MVAPSLNHPLVPQQKGNFEKSSILQGDNCKLVKGEQKEELPLVHVIN